MADTPPNICELLETEYKILQDKIDKIGAFKLTVRGWSVTIVLASLFAVASSKSLPPETLLVLLLFIAAFYLMERAELSLGRRLKARILQIEDVLTNLLQRRTPTAASLHGLGNVPGIGSQSARRRPVPLSWRFRRLPTELFVTTLLFYAAQATAVMWTVSLLKSIDQRQENPRPHFIPIERTSSILHPVVREGKE